MARPARRQLRGLVAAREGYRRLAAATGIATPALQAADVPPDATPDRAVSMVRRAAGERAWQDATRASSPLAAANLLRSAIARRRRSSNGGNTNSSSTTTRRRPRRRAAATSATTISAVDEDMEEPCARRGCGHAAYLHANGIDGCTECDCSEFIDADTQPAAPEAPTMSLRDAMDSPIVHTIAQRNGMSLEQVARAHLITQTQARDQPAQQQPRRMTLEQAKRDPVVIAVAERTGKPLAHVARAHLATLAQARDHLNKPLRRA